MSCVSLAKHDLIHNYFCDFITEVSASDRDAIDRALGEFLDKKSLYYGYNHSNQSINCLKKATKNIHKKVSLIHTASKKDAENHDTALATVQSVGFQNYFYKSNDPAGDPDELKWAFELGAKHRPLEKRDITASTPSHSSSSNLNNHLLLGSMAGDSGQYRRAARFRIQKQQQEENERILKQQQIEKENERVRKHQEELEIQRLNVDKERQKREKKQPEEPVKQKRTKSPLSTPKTKSKDSATKSARKNLNFTENDDYTNNDNYDTCSTAEVSSSYQGVSANKSTKFSSTADNTTTSGYSNTSLVSSISNSTNPKTGAVHFTETAMDYMHMQTTMFATQFQVEEVRDDLISQRKVCIYLLFIP